mgnify:CR=1 FL=1
MQLDGSMPIEQRLGILERDGWRCFYCGGRLVRTPNSLTTNQATIDHIVPASRGGTDENKNLVAACRRCNSQKHTKTLDEYRIWLAERDCWQAKARLLLCDVLAMPKTPFDDALTDCVEWLAAQIQPVIFYGDKA